MRPAIILVIVFIVAVIGFKLADILNVNNKEGMLSEPASTLSNSMPPKAEQLQYNSYDQQKSCAFLGEKNAANIAYLKEQLDGFAKVQQEMSSLKEKVDKNAAALDEIGNQLAKKSQSLTGRSADDKTPLPTASGLTT